jgi:hypothetical protein
MANETTSPETREGHIHPLNWIGWILAVVFLIAATVLAHHASWLRSRLSASQGHAAQLQLQLNHDREVVSVLTSPEAKHLMLTENRQPPRPSGEVSWLPSQGTLVFVAAGLRQLPNGKAYELWLAPKSGKAPLPAGLFRPSPDGSGTIVLPPLPADVQAARFLVTVEPEAGSATPSLPIVLQWEAAP